MTHHGMTCPFLENIFNFRIDCYFFCVSDIQEENNLVQFHDLWRKTQIGECDIYIYSAFQDSFRKGVDPCIKLNVAAPLDYKNKCADNAR